MSTKGRSEKDTDGLTRDKDTGGNMDCGTEDNSSIICIPTYLDTFFPSLLYSLTVCKYESNLFMNNSLTIHNS